jgi:hypothetical protein
LRSEGEEEHDGDRLRILAALVFRPLGQVSLDSIGRMR